MAQRPTGATLPTAGVWGCAPLTQAKFERGGSVMVGALWVGGFASLGFPECTPPGEPSSQESSSGGDPIPSTFLG